MEKGYAGVDTGYSWVILFATTVAGGIIVGDIKSFGIMYTELLHYYGTGSGNTAWIGSVKMFLNFALGPLSNYLCERYSYRAVVFCGGVLYGTGTFISAFVTKMELLYVTVGIIAGTGSGLIFTPSFTLVSLYFERRRALANGIFAAGSSLALLVLPYLYRMLIDYYGIHGAFMISGGITAHICIGASLLRQPILVNKRKSKPEGSSVPKNCNVGNKNPHDLNPEIFPVDHSMYREGNRRYSVTGSRGFFALFLFTNRYFYTIILAFIMFSLGHIGTFTVLPAQVTYLGFGNNKVALTLSLAGGMEMIAKLVLGLIVDLLSLRIKHVLFLLMTVSGVAAVIISFFHSYSGYVMYAVVFGIFAVPHNMFLPGMLLESIDIAYLSRGMGVATFCISFAYLLSQPVSGWIEDATETWDWSFRFIGIMEILGGALLILPTLTERKKTHYNVT